MMTKALKPSPEKLYSDQMFTYGLDEGDGAELKLSILEDASTISSGWFPQLISGTPGIAIPYFHPITGEVLRALPKSPPIYRVRLLGELKWALTNTPPPPSRAKEPPKYLNESKMGIGAYFPRNLQTYLKNGLRTKISWAEIIADSSQKLIITEGEFKAARACKASFPTIALGGVNNTHNISLGQAGLFPELEIINWVRREVFICFDSDFIQNSNVCEALQKLADKLYERGAIIRMVSIPPNPSRKIGLDDFLNDNSPGELIELLTTADYMMGVRELFAMNEKFIQVSEPPIVVSKITSGMWKMPDFLTNNRVKSFRPLIMSSKEKRLVGEPTSIGTAWADWPLRNHADKLTYIPTKLDDQLGRFEVNNISYYNTWKGWGAQPVKGDVTPFLEYFDYIFKGATPENKKWVMQWLAYPLQHPGVKLATSIAIQGNKTGTGKTMLGDKIMKGIYGSNFGEIRQSQISGDFNSWAIDKQFILCDDVSGSDRTHDADKIKNMITQTTTSINKKGVPEYDVPASINYMWTTNRSNAFLLDENDRRFFVHSTEVEGRSPDYYEKFIDWQQKGGIDRIFYHMLNDVDLTGFKPYGRAPTSEAKSDMIVRSQSDIHNWITEMLENPNNVLRIGDIIFKEDFFTAESILKFYDPDNKTRIHKTTIGTILGEKDVQRTAQIELDDGKRYRFYVIRNRAKWKKKPPNATEIKFHLKTIEKARSGS